MLTSHECKKFILIFPLSVMFLITFSGLTWGAVLKMSDEYGGGGPDIVIRDVVIIAIPGTSYSCSARVEFETNVPVHGLVYYRTLLPPNPLNVSQESPLGIKHSLILGGLSPFWLYQFRIEAQNGNVTGYYPSATAWSVFGADTYTLVYAGQDTTYRDGEVDGLVDGQERFMIRDSFIHSEVNYWTWKDENGRLLASGVGNAFFPPILTLPVGRHTLTLRGTDPDRNITGEDTVVITIVRR